MTADLSPDAVTLARRLIAEAGVHDGALMIPRAEVVAAIARAHDIGANSFAAKVNGDRHCRVCACTEFNPCRPDPCHWVAEDLCSACGPFIERIAA